MSKQGVLSYRIESEPASQNLTALTGLGAYLELAVGSGLVDSIRRNLSVCGEQGWTDHQILMGLVLLNLAGAQCLADISKPPDAAIRGSPGTTQAQVPKLVADLGVTRSLDDSGTKEYNTNIVGL